MPVAAASLAVVVREPKVETESPSSAKRERCRFVGFGRAAIIEGVRIADAADSSTAKLNSPSLEKIQSTSTSSGVVTHPLSGSHVASSDLSIASKVKYDSTLSP